MDGPPAKAIRMIRLLPWLLVPTVLAAGLSARGDEPALAPPAPADPAPPSSVNLEELLRRLQAMEQANQKLLNRVETLSDQNQKLSEQFKTIRRPAPAGSGPADDPAEGAAADSVGGKGTGTSPDARAGGRLPPFSRLMPKTATVGDTRAAPHG